MRPSIGKSYVFCKISFCFGLPMQLGGFFIWTYTFHLIRGSAAKLKALQAVVEVSKAPNNDLDASQETHLLNGQDQENVAIVVASSKSAEDTESHAVSTFTVIVSQESEHGKGNVSSWTKLTGFLHQILEELLEPPTVAAILGFVFGATTFLRNLIIGSEAPLRVIQDSIKLLGDGTIPCITLILGGNLTEGKQK
ncbi:hypothetical protein POTOM_021055 [Populus tomentosa]|uniref:Uncharacterized protein n=1 Tax=Populus tomentosa TaxID=118781 RepID=A0A8X7ZLT8_POPTO|nr:hypothetical protein POTOM_021055 [Populus tomentosa]